VKPCCSRLDLYKEHAGIDLRDIFPADEAKHDRAKIATWTWDAYLACADKLFKAGYPVGLPMGQTADSVDWVGALLNSYGGSWSMPRTTSGSTLTRRAKRWNT
jgi:ABC-type glycerol-3-phosphate transport system substrate-binding protein